MRMKELEEKKGKKKKVVEKIKVVFASLSKFFNELKERNIEEARVETVISSHSELNFRLLKFDIYVTARIDVDTFGVVVIPLFQTFQGLFEQQRDVINKKEEAFFERIEEEAGDRIVLRDGSFWEGEPFRGCLD